MREDKHEIVNALLAAVKLTRAGSDVVDMTYIPEKELVRISFPKGNYREVNVACDSGAALIRDVMRVI